MGDALNRLALSFPNVKDEVTGTPTLDREVEAKVDVENYHIHITMTHKLPLILCMAKSIWKPSRSSDIVD